MKSIIGKYILNDDDKNKYSILPNDFIDLENKIITWHSDSEKNNVLQLQLRTNGSTYEDYYQEFERFFDELFSFAYQGNLVRSQIGSTNEENPTIQKKLSLFNRLKKYNKK